MIKNILATAVLIGLFGFTCAEIYDVHIDNKIKNSEMYYSAQIAKIDSLYTDEISGFETSASIFRVYKDQMDIHINRLDNLKSQRDSILNVAQQQKDSLSQEYIFY